MQADDTPQEILDLHEALDLLDKLLSITQPLIAKLPPNKQKEWQQIGEKAIDLRARDEDLEAQS